MTNAVPACPDLPSTSFTVRDLGDLLHYLDLHPEDDAARYLLAAVLSHLGHRAGQTAQLAQRLWRLRQEKVPAEGTLCPWCGRQRPRTAWPTNAIPPCVGNRYLTVGYRSP